MQRADLARFREFWEDELQAAALYRALAETVDGDRREVFLELADTEERHAAHWADLLRDEGVEDLDPPAPSLRTRTLAAAGRRFGVEAVLPVVIRAEAADADKYREVAAAPGTMADEEIAHGRALAALGGVETAGARIATSEGRHRTGAGGALRAAVFGVNDGLVSNFSLVMGVAGGVDDTGVVLLAGVAGLFAGAFSMAAGEWISVRSQSELYEREIAVEAEELRLFPEEERDELELIYRAKGLPRVEAAALADRIMADPDTALDTLAREELGIDPTDLASPWVAAGSSFVAFALGALVPLLPFLVATGTASVVAAAMICAVALFGVGASLSVFTGRPPVRSGVRMVAIGGAAAAATYAIGALVGVTVT
ncbi:MAG: VIT1/CCC1 family protein [Actinobacteria bacterium]|nr:VIT1/CCC1 family protein [Actinomycetota bacterium]